MAIVITTQIGEGPWHLKGIRYTAGLHCDHCGMFQSNHYDVVNTATGDELTIARGCCEKVTGTALTRSQATYLLSQAALYSTRR